MRLNRSLINKIRFILEDILPAFIRDSFFFYLLLKLVYGSRARTMAEFRSRVTTMSREELIEYYRLFPALLETTDLNEACIRRIAQELVGQDVVDVGCGRGWLANHLAENSDKRITGVDFLVPAELRTRYPKVRFVEGPIENLPFPDASFDTVICSHTLEHVVDFAQAVSELRRICRKRLIIVVPSEREYKYAFNLHVNFFPYKHSLLNRLRPLPQVHACEVLDGDIFYLEDQRRTGAPEHA